MKNFKKLFTLILIALFAFTFVGCTKNNPDPDDPDIPVTPVEISLELSANTITKGETVNATVTVTNATDKTYTFSVSDETLVKIENNKVSVIADITIDKIVSITVKSNEDSRATATKTLVVKAPYIEGQVGELTSEMLKELGNDSITVTGVVKDIYQDFKQTANSGEQEYGFEVQMSDGAWRGSWSLVGNEEDAVVDNYRRGTTDGLKDQYGNIGHGLERLYINKNNEVQSQLVKDYISVPAVWEAQHLWNHLGNLTITKFEYDVENNVYHYNYDKSNEDDLYLLTYLAYSLTPMLEDTLDELYLVVENGEIVKLLAQTEILYYGSDTVEDADALSYTTVEIVFSNIGSTVVPNPQAYEAPEYVEKLTAALTKMQNAKNYTFQAKDVQTYAPAGDGNDYQISAVASNGAVAKAMAHNPFISNKVVNNVSSVGVVGCFGQITEAAVLFAETGKYSYSMDDKLYHTEYSGYRQNNDNTYERFEYSTTEKTLVGKTKRTGSFFEVLPSFDLSPNIFELLSTSTMNGKTTYTFKLRETAVTRDVALEVSAYKYADDAEASVGNALTIVVDDQGNLISTTYPYSLISGTYMGYCTTTYKEVGTTKLDDDLFEGYIPRVLKTSWDEYIINDYSPTFSTKDQQSVAASVVFESIYGSSVSDVPSPVVFQNIFGDAMSGPWYDWKSIGTDADGNEINRGCVDINVTSDEYDENMQITNYEELMATMQEELGKLGFKLSPGNTDTSKPKNRYVCFIKGDVQIVVHNIGTRYLYITFYKTGDWTLNK